ncbi:cell cycle checkpoint protein RAD17 [Pieris napi]|uniref:cell cycle checkpoint protein RAD17 n=1 Tax=Pieris napi TaxID=78633 RepID=UPI001FB8D29E|nr:cell cycle checkpoint protein RAD17 [Pieris napi]
MHAHTIMGTPKGRKWFKPMFEFEEPDPPKKKKGNSINKPRETKNYDKEVPLKQNNNITVHNVNNKNWMKNFDPVNIEDLAVHNKKVQEVEEWLKCSCLSGSNSNMLLLSGPVGCGKTATIYTLAVKHDIKLTEWITPVDIEIPSDYGDYHYKESQTKKFLDFIINAANFTSLLDSNSKKLVLVEDFPNAFLRTPADFTDILQQYKRRAKSPLVFICSETHSDNKNTALHLFTPTIKDQFNINHIMFNSISVTGLKSALKRTVDIISKKYTTMYNIPSPSVVDSVVHSSGGDVRSAILNLHFAALKGSTMNLETSIIQEKEVKSKGVKRKKNSSSKFMSLGKDQTVSILHGVGRVLNPKVVPSENGGTNLTHSPRDVIEQFISHPSSFIAFLEENYLAHFSSLNDVDKAASALSDGDFMLGEWREKTCQEYGLYTAVAGLMLANKAPVSAWNPVRGPKNMRVQYPTLKEMPQLDKDYLYKAKVLVTDYLTYCKIIGNKAEDILLDISD